MKRWILACLVFLVAALPVGAEALRPALPTDQPAGGVRLTYLRFPAVKFAAVETGVDPHIRARLTVAGSDWSFSLVERRWGWELETAQCPWDVQCALAFSTLDYLNGQPRALSIFLSVPAEYMETLLAL